MSITAFRMPRSEREREALEELVEARRNLAELARRRELARHNALVWSAISRPEPYSPRSAPIIRRAFAHEMGDYSDLVESLPLFHASPDFVSTFSALSEDAPSVKDWPEKPFMLHFATRLWGRWVALAYLGDERFVALSIEETDDDYELAVVSDTKWGRLISWIIDNPDLMEKTPRDLRPKAERRQRNKSRPDHPRLVTIVDLRAAHREAAADVAAAERTYRSRWIVRGHWHRFWTGPRDGERKLEARYVMPYVKGPAGAPLNVTERVKKW